MTCLTELLKKQPKECNNSTSNSDNKCFTSNWSKLLHCCVPFRPDKPSISECRIFNYFSWIKTKKFLTSLWLHWPFGNCQNANNLEVTPKKGRAQKRSHPLCLYKIKKYACSKSRDHLSVIALLENKVNSFQHTVQYNLFTLEYNNIKRI